MATDPNIQSYIIHLLETKKKCLETKELEHFNENKMMYSIRIDWRISKKITLLSNGLTCLLNLPSEKNVLKRFQLNNEVRGRHFEEQLKKFL